MNNAIEKYSTVLWISLFVLAMAARLSVAIATPDWQAVDEYPHYYVAEYLAEHGSFPQSKPEHPHYEAYQPPLFYLGLAAWIKLNPPENPPVFSFTGSTHTGYMLYLRLFPLLLSLFTLFTACLFFKEQRLPVVAQFAGFSFLAFLPTFVNVGSTLNNDAAVVLFCTLAVRFFFIGLESFSLKNALGFGVAMGLALFSKVNAIFLFPAFGLIAFMHRAKLKPVRNILWAGLPILVFAILLIIRNVLVFGEVTAINPGAPKQWDISVSHILWAFRNLSWSFIFAFGRTYEIQPDMWLLITPALLFVVFIFRYFRDSLRPKQTEPLALFTAVGLASLIAASLYYTLSYPEGSMTSWGKNLYPALLPLSAIVGLGVAKAGKSGIAGFITYMLLVIYGLITVIQFMA